MDGIQFELSVANVILVALPRPSTEPAYEYLKHIIIKQLVDGFILTGTTPIDPRIQLLQSANMPFICLGRTYADTNTLWADIDYASAAQLAVERLVAEGHRTIAAVVQKADYPGMVQYLDGFKRGLEASNIAFRPELVFSAPCSEAGGTEAADLVMSSHLKPTAAVFSCDLTAIGFHRRLGEVNRKSDEALASISIRSHDFTDTRSKALTCFELDTTQFGRSIGRLMLSQIPGLPFDYSAHAQNICQKMVLVQGLTDKIPSFA